MASNQLSARLLGVLVIAMLLAVAACGVTPGAKATPAATATAIVPTPATGNPRLVNCATLPGMQGARQGIEVFDTDFPDSGAAIVTITSAPSATMQIVRYVACMQVFAQGTVGNVSVPVVSNTSSATAEVIEALNLVNRGWGQSAVFPFDGTHLQSCTTAQLCYAGGPQSYLELEQIAAQADHVVTFVMRVASPRPLAPCDPALFPGEVYPASTSVLANAEFPLPPATRLSMGFGDATGITTYFCTAGSAAAIQAYMAAQLPSAGWSPLTVNGVRVWKFPSGIGPVYMRINPITDPLKWSVLTYNPGTNLG